MAAAVHGARIDMCCRVVMLMGSWLLMAASALSAAEPAPGRYKLYVARGRDKYLAVCILQLDKKDAGWSAAMLARNTALGKVTVGPAKMVDGFLRMDLNISEEDVVFEGTARDASTIIGSCGGDRRLNVAMLLSTDEDVVVRERMNLPRELPPPMKELARLEAERAEAEKLVHRTVIAGDQHRMSEELDRINKKIDRERPELIGRLLEQHADDPCAGEAGLMLLFHCYRLDATVDQLRKWTEATLQAGGKLGPRYQRDLLLSAIEYVARCGAGQPLAIELSDRAAPMLAGEPRSTQARVLAIRLAALRQMGQTDSAASVEKRLAELDARLDEEYRAQLPKVAVAPFGKRRDKANCVAILELFVGAEAATCAAAEAALEQMLPAYKANEAVLLQYHLHVPGPDALANDDAEARWQYYAEKYPRHTEVIPLCLVSGRPKAPGGGTLSQTKAKVNEYIQAVNPMVNEITPVEMSASAKRVDEKVEIEIKVEGVPADSRERKMRLRVALVEDSVLYPGGNGVRYHRHVVRAMPGGAEGKLLIQDSDTWRQSVDMNELKVRLAKAIDKTAANGSPFPTPYRPMELTKLKIIGWVQSDNDRAIWQAIQADVKPE